MGISTSDDIIQMRRQEAEAGECLDTETRSVTHNHHGGVRHNIPATAATILGITEENEVRIHIFDDGYWVEKVDKNEC